MALLMRLKAWFKRLLQRKERQSPSVAGEQSRSESPFKLRRSNEPASNRHLVKPGPLTKMTRQIYHRKMMPEALAEIDRQYNREGFPRRARRKAARAWARRAWQMRERA